MSFSIHDIKQQINCHTKQLCHQHYRNFNDTARRVFISILQYDLNPKCEWLPSAVFSRNDSEIINHQIIQIDQQHLNYHRICFCYNNGSYSCSRNILGPIYPGQVLQIGLCTPCDDNLFSLYVETHDALQTNFLCKITKRDEIMHNISHNVNLINYTIASEAYKMCKLFLTVYSHKQLYAYEVFYVKLLSCPVGFTLQNGVCDCDHISLPITLTNATLIILLSDVLLTLGYLFTLNPTTLTT